MHTSKLVLACPGCASTDIYYTCTPNCCFNHVCASCGTTFEPVTRRTGETITGITPPDPLPDATDPTVACAKCDATTVYRTDKGTLVCATCGSVLTVELTEVATG